MNDQPHALRRLVARYLDRLLIEQTELQIAHLEERSSAADERKARLDYLLMEIEACRMALADKSSSLPG